MNNVPIQKRVNIVGAGLSGLYLAINLARNGIYSNLISNMASERAQSVLAEGGINASLNTMGEDDTIFDHYTDTKKGGAYLESDDAIYNLVNNAIDIVKDLVNLGVPFQYENNHLILRNFGGQLKKRTAYAKSSTGKMIMTALIDEARKYEERGFITRFKHHECVDCNVLDNGKDITLESIIVKDLYTNEYYEFKGLTVLASGGFNGFFEGHVTGSILNTSIIQAILYKKGLKFRNLEFIQYHPTTIDIKVKRLLVSEAARGEGGRLLVYKDGNPYYFMEDRHPLKNLAPRDVISKNEYLILNDPSYGKQIYLDMRSIDKNTWDDKLPDLRKEVNSYLDIDPMKDLIPVSPGIHYFMGGILVDLDHKTNINNLYAIGEASSIYHGANRLGGNSMLGALVGGLLSSRSIIKDNQYPACTCNKISYQELDFSYEDDKYLKDILINSLGIIRNKELLEDGLQKINDKLNSHKLKELNYNKYLLGKAMIASALNRKESRGSHQRSDYPDSVDKYLTPTISQYDKDVKVWLRGMK